MLAGADLYDTARRWIEAGIRDEHPDADDDTVRALVLERLRRGGRRDRRVE